jgi:DNA modification methylase
MLRSTTALPINQIVCGHAAEVIASWPSRSIDLIITSPPYWDAVIYDGEMPPWRSYRAYLDDLQTVWVESGPTASSASTRWPCQSRNG